MANDRAIGALILIGSLAGIGIYFWLTFYSAWSLLTVKVTAFVAVALILAILAWIGWTLATTPPPTPIEEMPLEAPPGPESEEEKPEE